MATSVTGTPQKIPFHEGNANPATSPVASLTIADDVQRRAPTALTVVVTGMDPAETVSFSVGGHEIWSAVADSTGSIFYASIAIGYTYGSSDFDAGTYTLTATGEGSGRVGTDEFTLAIDPSPFPQVQAPDVDPVEIDGRGNHWVLQDAKPGGLGSWIMDPSPTSMVQPELDKIVTVDHSTNPHTGQYHISASDSEVQDWSFSGYCPDKDFYDQLVAYGSLNRRLYVIDHRGRAWKTVILRTDMTPRKRQIEGGVANDWAHDYVITAQIFQTTSFEPVSP